MTNERILQEERCYRCGITLEDGYTVVPGDREGDWQGDDNYLCQLCAEIVSQGDWRCPYCGEAGGEPKTVYSREFQGEEGHGGMVEWEDERCSFCIREEKYREAMLENLGYVPALGISEEYGR